MKILLWPFIYFPSFGGVEMMTYSLATEFQKMGHEVVIFADDPFGGAFSEKRVDNLLVYYFPFSAVLSSRRPRLIKKTIDAAFEILDQFKPDLASIHGIYEFFAFFQLRVLKNIPFFLTVHGPLEERQYCRSASCLELWSKAKGVNTVSYAMFDQLSRENWNHPFFTVISNGVSPSRFPEPISETRADRIAMIGRFSPEKCFSVGFHAFKKVKKAFPEATLCLAGKGDEEDLLLKLRKELELENAIEMPGFIAPDKVHTILDEATVVWIPSLYESFGLVSIEAAIRGRPVIASDALGLKEAIEQGKTGLLVEPKNPDALARATISLLKNPELRRKMGRYAKERAEKLFSMESCAGKYIEMYTQNL